jgi:signal transduction histidine kinase
MVEQRTAQLEQSRLQMAHRENLAALGRLAAGMAHEIGNPLSAVSTLCQLVARRRREDPFVSEQLGLIETHVRRLTDLTARMMDLARPPSLDRTLVEVNEAVESACKLARMDRRLARRELRLELSAGLPRIPSHPDVLIQSMINLLLNAADASPEHSHITVTTAQEGETIVIRIRDEGAGVPPGLERAIFEPFFTTKSPDRGSGLGLSVSLSLLRSVGADLNLRSEPGRGATFVISLNPKGGG